MSFLKKFKRLEGTIKHILTGWVVIEISSVIASAFKDSYRIMAVLLKIFIIAIIIIFIYEVVILVISTIKNIKIDFSRFIRLAMVAGISLILLYYYKPIVSWSKIIIEKTTKKEPSEEDPIIVDKERKTLFTITKKDSVKKIPFSPKKLKSWNELIDGKAFCHNSPLQILNLREVTEEKAKIYLQSIPHLPEGVKRRRRIDIKDEYVFDTYSSKFEVWNKKAEDFYRSLSSLKLQSYKRDIARNKESLNRWLKKSIWSYLERKNKEMIEYRDFDPECPRIVLYHSTEDPSPPNPNSLKRHRTYEYHEYHVYWFRNQSLFKDN